MKKNILILCCIVAPFLFVVFLGIGISLSIQPIRFGVKYNYIYEDEGATNKKTICFYKNGTVTITSEISVQKHKISESSRVGIYVIGGEHPYSEGAKFNIYVTIYTPSNSSMVSTDTFYLSVHRNGKSLVYNDYGKMELKVTVDNEAIIWTLCLLLGIASTILIFVRVKGLKK